MNDTTPNRYCVVLGNNGASGIVGPFDTHDEATAHAGKHATENPGVPAVVETLIDPANC